MGVRLDGRREWQRQTRKKRKEAIEEVDLCRRILGAEWHSFHDKAATVSKYNQINGALWMLKFKNGRGPHSHSHSFSACCRLPLAVSPPPPPSIAPPPPRRSCHPRSPSQKSDFLAAWFLLFLSLYVFLGDAYLSTRGPIFDRGIRVSCD